MLENRTKKKKNNYLLKIFLRGRLAIVGRCDVGAILVKASDGPGGVAVLPRQIISEGLDHVEDGPRHDDVVVSPHQERHHDGSYSSS